MEKIPVYIFFEDDGTITVSPIKPEREYTEQIRIIAGEGKRITKDGERLYVVKDDDSDEGYYEVDDPDPPTDDYEEFESEEE